MQKRVKFVCAKAKLTAQVCWAAFNKLIKKPLVKFLELGHANSQLGQDKYGHHINRMSSLRQIENGAMTVPTRISMTVPTWFEVWWMFALKVEESHSSTLFKPHVRDLIGIYLRSRMKSSPGNLWMKMQSGFIIVLKWILLAFSDTRSMRTSTNGAAKKCTFRHNDRCLNYWFRIWKASGSNAARMLLKFIASNKAFYEHRLTLWAAAYQLLSDINWPLRSAKCLSASLVGGVQRARPATFIRL